MLILPILMHAAPLAAHVKDVAQGGGVKVAREGQAREGRGAGRGGGEDVTNDVAEDVSGAAEDGGVKVLI